MNYQTNWKWNRRTKKKFLGMLLATLRPSLLGNILTGKRILRAGYGNKEWKGILRVGYRSKTFFLI